MPRWRKLARCCTHSSYEFDKRELTIMNWTVSSVGTAGEVRRDPAIGGVEAVDDVELER